MVLGKLDNYVQKNETKPLSYAAHKSNQEWIKVLSERPETVKLLVENISVLSPRYRSCGWFFYFIWIQKQRQQKQKWAHVTTSNLMKIKIKKLHNKRNHQQN